MGAFWEQTRFQPSLGEFDSCRLCMNKIELAKNIVSNILNELEAKDGFCRWWWDDLEESSKDYVRNSLTARVESLLEKNIQ